MDVGGRATQEQLPRTQMTQMIMMNTDNPNGVAVSTRFNCVFQDNSKKSYSIIIIRVICVPLIKTLYSHQALGVNHA